MTDKIARGTATSNDWRNWRHCSAEYIQPPSLVTWFNLTRRLATDSRRTWAELGCGRKIDSRVRCDECWSSSNNSSLLLRMLRLLMMMMMRTNNGQEGCVGCVIFAAGVTQMWHGLPSVQYVHRRQFTTPAERARVISGRCFSVDLPQSVRRVGSTSGR